MNNQFQEQEYSKNFDWQVWKKLLSFAKPFGKYYVFSIGSLIILSLIDALYPFISKIAIDNFIVPETLDGFGLYVTALIGLIVIQAVSVFTMIYFNGRVEAGIPYLIRKATFEKLQTLSLAYYNKTPTGWLMARLTSDVRKLGLTMTWNAIDLLWALVMMVVMAIAMFSLNWKLALIVMGTVPFLIGVSLVFQRVNLRNHRRSRKINSNIINAFNEGITGARTIKTLVAEEHCIGEFNDLTQEMRQFSVRAATVASIYTPIVMLLGSIGTGAILWWGGVWTQNDFVSLGTLAAFISYTTQFFEPVKQFARILGELQYAQASAERVLSLMDIEPDVQDSAEVIEKYGDILNPKTENWPELHGDVTFENVSFSYDDSDTDVLESFSLNVRQGETIAIVGETGSGKTTIVNMACRFFEPTSGRILIDGKDYRELPMLWLQSKLGYVLQEPHLFNGTIYDNIVYSNQHATREMVENAAKLVNAHDFIVNLEKGYDTDVGERGSRLSAGQRQLISFARAILADPRIFVLDEATSSVDTETEHLIKDAISKILQGRTSFIIAHRLSTIRSADRILVLDKGRIVEDGSHKQLMKLHGRYFNLYTNQFLEDTSAGQA